MRSIRYLIVGFLTGFLLWPTDAQAVTTIAVFNASGACAWNTSSVADATNEPSGFYNEQDGALTLLTSRTAGHQHRLTCDLQTTVPSSASFQAYVYFYDDVSDTDMADDVFCNLVSCNTSGSSCSNSGTRFGNGTGGATTDTPYSGGDGYIVFNSVSRSGYTTTAATCNVPGIGSTTTQRGRVKRFWVNWIT